MSRNEKKEEIRYFDKDGKELFPNDIILIEGVEKKLYLTEGGDLGVDATSTALIERGKALPCEYGVYPLVNWHPSSIQLVKRAEKK